MEQNTDKHNINLFESIQKDENEHIIKVIESLHKDENYYLAVFIICITILAVIGFCIYETFNGYIGFGWTVSIIILVLSLVRLIEYQI